MNRLVLFIFGIVTDTEMIDFDYLAKINTSKNVELFSQKNRIKIRTKETIDLQSFILEHVYYVNNTDNTTITNLTNLNTTAEDVTKISYFDYTFLFKIEIDDTTKTNFKITPSTIFSLLLKFPYWNQNSGASESELIPLITSVTSKYSIDNMGGDYFINREENYILFCNIVISDMKSRSISIRDLRLPIASIIQGIESEVYISNDAYISAYSSTKNLTIIQSSNIISAGYTGKTYFKDFSISCANSGTNSVTNAIISFSFPNFLVAKSVFCFLMNKSPLNNEFDFSLVDKVETDTTTANNIFNGKSYNMDFKVINDDNTIGILVYLNNDYIHTDNNNKIVSFIIHSVINPKLEGESTQIDARLYRIEDEQIYLSLDSSKKHTFTTTKRDTLKYASLKYYLTSFTKGDQADLFLEIRVSTNTYKKYIILIELTNQIEIDKSKWTETFANTFVTMCAFSFVNDSKEQNYGLSMKEISNRKDDFAYNINCGINTTTMSLTIEVDRDLIVDSDYNSSNNPGILIKLPVINTRVFDSTNYLQFKTYDSNLNVVEYNDSTLKINYISSFITTNYIKTSNSVSSFDAEYQISFTLNSNVIENEYLSIVLPENDIKVSQSNVLTDISVIKDINLEDSNDKRILETTLIRSVDYSVSVDTINSNSRIKFKALSSNVFIKDSSYLVSIPNGLTNPYSLTTTNSFIIRTFKIGNSYTATNIVETVRSQLEDLNKNLYLLNLDSYYTFLPVEKEVPNKITNKYPAPIPYIGIDSSNLVTSCGYKNPFLTSFTDQCGFDGTIIEYTINFVPSINTYINELVIIDIPKKNCIGGNNSLKATGSSKNPNTSVFQKDIDQVSSDCKIAFTMISTKANNYSYDYYINNKDKSNYKEEDFVSIKITGLNNSATTAKEEGFSVSIVVDDNWKSTVGVQLVNPFTKLSLPHSMYSSIVSRAEQASVTEDLLLLFEFFPYNVEKELTKTDNYIKIIYPNDFKILDDDVNKAACYTQYNATRYYNYDNVISEADLYLGKYLEIDCHVDLNERSFGFFGYKSLSQTYSKLSGAGFPYSVVLKGLVSAHDEISQDHLTTDSFTIETYFIDISKRLLDLSISNDITNNSTESENDTINNYENKTTPAGVPIYIMERANNDNLKFSYSCHEDCSACSILTDECTKCYYSGQKPYLYKGSCLDKCPDNTSLDKESNNCIKCSDNCLSCSFSNSNYCLSCEDDLYLSNGKCVSSCPSDNYIDYENKSCEKCAYPCTQCQNNKTCYACDGLSTILYLNSCINTCPEGTLKSKLPSSNNQATYTCSLCDENCKSCKDSSSKCTSCKSNMILFKDECLSSCPENYIYDSYSKTCLVCPKSCSQCQVKSNQETNSSQVICSRCNSNFFLNDKSECEERISSCPDAYYLSSSLNKCFECQDNCLECISNTYCTKCSGKSYSLKGSCNSTCLDGYFLTYNDSKSVYECQICNFNCKTCERKANYCTSCINSLILYNNNCIDSCPSSEGYYESTDQNNNIICKSCPDNCSKCQSTTDGVICNSCIQNYFMTPSLNCSLICPDSYTADTITSTCILSSGIAASRKYEYTFTPPFTYFVFLALMIALVPICLLIKKINNNLSFFQIYIIIGSLIINSHNFLMIKNIYMIGKPLYLISFCVLLGLKYLINTVFIIIDTFHFVKDSKYAYLSKIKCFQSKLVSTISFLSDYTFYKVYTCNYKTIEKEGENKACCISFETANEYIYKALRNTMVIDLIVLKTPWILICFYYLVQYVNYDVEIWGIVLENSLIHIFIIAFYLIDLIYDSLVVKRFSNQEPEKLEDITPVFNDNLNSRILNNHSQSKSYSNKNNRSSNKSKFSNSNSISNKFSNNNQYNKLCNIDNKGSIKAFNESKINISEIKDDFYLNDCSKTGILKTDLNKGKFYKENHQDTVIDDEFLNDVGKKTFSKESSKSSTFLKSENKISKLEIISENQNKENESSILTKKNIILLNNSNNTPFEKNFNTDNSSVNESFTPISETNANVKGIQKPNVGITSKLSNEFSLFNAGNNE